MTELFVNTERGGYPVTVGQGLLENVCRYFSLDRRVFIITDTGVPAVYAKTVAAACRTSTVYTVPEGEGSKSLSTAEAVLRAMLDFGMTRTDCVVAVGGGVVGDLSGFVAATFMRGIDFYNVPTTLLSQVDSSVGGKTAVNLGGVKNSVGIFYPPRAVLVDTDTLATLSARQLSSGMCEIIKMAASADGELFSVLEDTSVEDAICEHVIARAIDIKRLVVEHDEHESGLRRILNLGHTLGHAIETAEGLGGLLHGECVALGMIPVCSDEVLSRVIPLFEKFSLPIEYKNDMEVALDYIKHDKKCDGDAFVFAVFCDKIGTARIERISQESFIRLVRERMKR